jgi:hypothetical protein
MCELEPPISAVPDAFITGLEFDVFPISVKYLQEYSFWESIVMGRHPRQLLKTMARAEYPQNKTYRFVRRTLAVERVNIVDSTPASGSGEEKLHSDDRRGAGNAQRRL